MSEFPTYFISSQDQDFQIRIKVQPGSAQSQIIGAEKNFLKVKLHSPPVSGNANKELIKLMAKKFRLGKQNIQILKGEKARIKLLRIKGISVKEFLTVVSSPH